MIDEGKLWCIMQGNCDELCRSAVMNYDGKVVMHGEEICADL